MREFLFFMICIPSMPSPHGEGGSRSETDEEKGGAF